MSSIEGNNWGLRIQDQDFDDDGNDEVDLIDDLLNYKSVDHLTQEFRNRKNFTNQKITIEGEAKRFTGVDNAFGRVNDIQLSGAIGN